jgi:hypothetical protein
MLEKQMAQSANQPTEDEIAFGVNVWVHCCAHERPHVTGWCTAPLHQKTLLDAQEYYLALKECSAKGLKLY